MESQADTGRYNAPQYNCDNNQDREENGNEGQDVPDAVGSRPSSIKFNPEDLYYDMRGEKHLVVFNHYEYDEVKNPLDKRDGTEEDVKALYDTFENIGFSVVVHHDKRQEEIWDILQDLRAKDFRAASCLCIAILTHGTEGGRLCAYDREYHLDHVTKLFENHPTLAGKPKLFFVQACRGDKMDDGNRIERDGEMKNYFVVPTHADFLIVRSTVEDFLSWKDSRGSWMIQELCSHIRQCHNDLDILQILTLVQRKVAFAYATYVEKDITQCNKVQMVETTFTLTKFLKL